MIRRCLALLAVPVLAACGEAAPPPAETPSTAPTASATGTHAEAPGTTVITHVGDLIGEYRVAGIDGRPLAADFAIALSIDGPMMSFEPTCAGFVWSIAFPGERLVTERPGSVPAPGGTTPPVCAVAVHPEQRRLALALDAAERVVRTPGNAVELSGGGRSVTLFSQ